MPAPSQLALCQDRPSTQAEVLQNEQTFALSIQKYQLIAAHLFLH